MAQGVRQYIDRGGQDECIFVFCLKIFRKNMIFFLKIFCKKNGEDIFSPPCLTTLFNNVIKQRCLTSF
jgi:hypothetical protein